MGEVKEMEMEEVGRGVKDVEEVEEVEEVGSHSKTASGNSSMLHSFTILISKQDQLNFFSVAENTCFCLDKTAQSISLISGNQSMEKFPGF